MRIRIRLLLLAAIASPVGGHSLLDDDRADPRYHFGPVATCLGGFVVGGGALALTYAAFSGEKGEKTFSSWWWNEEAVKTMEDVAEIEAKGERRSQLRDSSASSEASEEEEEADGEEDDEDDEPKIDWSESAKDNTAELPVADKFYVYGASWPWGFEDTNGHSALSETPGGKWNPVWQTGCNEQNCHVCGCQFSHRVLLLPRASGIAW